MIENEKMTVVGLTSSREVYAANRKRNFRINEFLIVEDAQGQLISEVVEANTFNRYIPMSKGGDFVDQSVISSLQAIGWNVNEETIYIAKLRLLREAQFPVMSGSKIRVPEFYEVKNLLISSEPETGLVLGAIRNTDSLTLNMEDKYKGLFTTFENGIRIPQKDVPYILDYKSLHEYPHVGVFGGSGSGKSFGIRVLIEEIMKKGIPTIVMDPHFEMSFANSKSDVNYEGKYNCRQIGIDIGIKFEDLSTGDLKNLLDTSGSISDAMRNTIDIMFKRGENYYTFSNRLNELLVAFEYGSTDKINRKIEEVDAMGDSVESEKFRNIRATYEKYGNSTNQATVRGILWRLQRLKNEGVLDKDITPTVDGIMSGKVEVIQGSTRMIQVFATYLVNKLYNMRRDYREGKYAGHVHDFFPPFIVITDEAHNFAPKGVDSPTKHILREIAQEGRKYGVFLVLATQRPTLLDDTITAQLNTKLIFRTVRASDIDTIREETDISTEESKRLPYLQTGDVFVSSSKLGRTSYVRIRYADTESPHKENPFDELQTLREKDNEEFYEKIREVLPIATSVGSIEVLRHLKNKGTDLTVEQLKLKLDELVRSGYLKVESSFLGEQYMSNK